MIINNKQMRNRLRNELNPNASSDINAGNETISCPTTLNFCAPPKDSPEMAWWRDSMKTHDARMAWWREGRFGMMISWGVWAHLGNIFHGKPGSYYSEHIQRALRIPISVYDKEVAGSFNPAQFDADAWIRTAKEAGMSYIAVLAKHHDGFAMWPSKASRRNVMDATPWKRDPMRELQVACKKYGVRFGVYYSQAFDWGEENGVGNDWDFPDHPGGDLHRIGGHNWWENRPDYLKTVRSYVDGKSIPQLLELIQNYQPDLIWFDTPAKLPPIENWRILKAVREAAPNIVVNDRIVEGLGDYASTCDRPGEFHPLAGDWEAIPTTNESYGWSPIDHSHKPPAFFIQLLAKSVARGGNQLLNIGPMGNGAIDPKDLNILKGIAKWWKVNGESIRGCSATPLAPQIWGESTRKKNTIFLHVFNWPKDGKLMVGGLTTPVVSARLLGGGALPVSRINPLDIAIEIPKRAPDAVNSVIAVECVGEPVGDSPRLLQSTLGPDTLRAFDATLQGKGLAYGEGKATLAYVSGITNPSQALVWPVRVNEESVFDVSVVCDGTDAPRTLALTAAGQILRASPKTKSVLGQEPLGEGWWALKACDNQTLPMGRLTLSPGAHELRLSPESNFGSDAMRVRDLILTPVRK